MTMNCNNACHTLHRLTELLKQLAIVYGYLIQNAPTEDSRRMMELNLMTVRNSLARLEDIMNEMSEFMTPTGETLEQIPSFTNFVEAARFAFTRETQVIAMANNLIMMIDDCYHNSLRGIIVDHQLNAMRILFVLT